MFGQLMLIRQQLALLNSEDPTSLKPNTEHRLNKGEIVFVISDKDLVSEFCVLTSIGIGWVHKENLVEVGNQPIT